MISGEASLLRVYVNINERWHGRPLYEAVVQRARELGMAGASVFQAELSFGSHHQLHDVTSDYRFAEAPVIIEIVDGQEQIEALVRELGPTIAEGFLTIEPVRVIRYGRPEERGRG